MRKVIDNRDAFRGADDFEPPPDTGKAFESLGRRFHIDASRHRGADRCQRVCDIVRARDMQMHRHDHAAVALLQPEANPVRRRIELAREQPRARIDQAEIDDVLGRQIAGKRQRFGIVAVHHRGPRLGDEIAEQRSQFVERLVIE